MANRTTVIVKSSRKSLASNDVVRRGHAPVMAPTAAAPAVPQYMLNEAAYIREFGLYK